MKRLLIATAVLELGVALALLCVATIMADEFFNMYDKTGPGHEQLQALTG